MLNQTQNLRNKILKGSKESNLFDIYHYLMINYGYIPFEDFKKMDANLVNTLVEKLNKMNEESQKVNKGRGRRK